MFLYYNSRPNNLFSIDRLPYMEIFHNAELHFYSLAKKTMRLVRKRFAVLVGPQHIEFVTCVHNCKKNCRDVKPNFMSFAGLLCRIPSDSIPTITIIQKNLLKDRKDAQKFAWK